MRFQIDGTIVDTEKSKNSWAEKTDWNGRNQISRNTGDQWEHETLYLSTKDNFYLVSNSDWQGSIAKAEFISDEDAAKWLILNEHELPENLKEFIESFCE